VAKEEKGKEWRDRPKKGGTEEKGHERKGHVLVSDEEERHNDPKDTTNRRDDEGPPRSVARPQWRE
jgi:hypothetical protein